MHIVAVQQNFLNRYLLINEELAMYEDFMKMAQDSMKPMLKLAENNTALAVKLLNSQTEKKL
jgi:hypothetical protein